MAPCRTERSDLVSARRQAGESLAAWLYEVEHRIGQAERRQIAALATELTGRRLRGVRR